MTRPPLVSVALMAAFAAASLAFAADEPATTKPAAAPTVAERASNPILAAPADRPAGAMTGLPGKITAVSSPEASRTRLVSPTLSTQLTALAPKYQPAAAAKAFEPGVDLREVDKPKNTIYRLPNFEVQEEKIPDMKPRELLTPPERLRQAYRKHPGLHFGSLPFLSNDGVALAMQAEEERLERIKEMSDLLSLLPTKQQKQVKPMVDDAFLRKDLPR